MRARVNDLVFLGNALKIAATLPSGETLSVRDSDLPNAGAYAIGAPEDFCWDTEAVRVLEAAP